MTMTEMTNGIATTTETPKPAKAKVRKKPAAKAKPRKAGKKAARKAKARAPKHWSDTHAQLVLHATPELVKKLDRKLNALAKKLGCNASRGAVIRALVEKAIR